MLFDGPIISIHLIMISRKGVILVFRIPSSSLFVGKDAAISWFATTLCSLHPSSTKSVAIRIGWWVLNGVLLQVRDGFKYKIFYTPDTWVQGHCMHTAPFFMKFPVDLWFVNSSFSSKYRVLYKGWYFPLWTFDADGSQKMSDFGKQPNQGIFRGRPSWTKARCFPGPR